MEMDTHHQLCRPCSFDNVSLPGARLPPDSPVHAAGYCTFSNILLLYPAPFLAYFPLAEFPPNPCVRNDFIHVLPDTRAHAGSRRAAVQWQRGAAHADRLLTLAGVFRDDVLSRGTAHGYGTPATAPINVVAPAQPGALGNRTDAP